MAVLIAAFAASASASDFVPNSAIGRSVASSTARTPQGSEYIASQQPVSIRKSRSSVASVQTMGLFGLGGPEIAVILVAAAFLLGPQKLAELGKDAGKIAGELKEVPKEFQAGMAEGEEVAKQIKNEVIGEAKDAETE